MIELDLKQYERNGRCYLLVLDKVNNQLYKIANFSCPATAYWYLRDNVYGFDPFSTKHYRDFQSYWYYTDKPLEDQVHKKYYKQIKTLMES